MSRIHDALKKAALERSSHPAAELERDAEKLVREVHRSVAIEPSSSRPVERARESSAGKDVSLQYEELIKHCAQPAWRVDPASNVFRVTNSANGVSERFRTLRSRLYEYAGSRTLRRLLITSGLAGEGKTFVASNLAQSIVQQPERRVLLIDADLRAPRLHSAFGASRFPGLTDYLRGEADEYSVIQKGLAENLCLIPAGKPVAKPSELLLSERMKKVLSLLTPMFDWIIIDSPPTLPVHDSSILAGMTDGVLLVVRAGVTHVAAAEKAASEFKAKNLLGVVFNQAKDSETYGGYKYPYSA